MIGGSSWIVLSLGELPVATADLVDNESIFAAERREDALLVHWGIELEDDDEDEAIADAIVGVLGADLLAEHRDPEGVLVVPVRELVTPSGDYVALVRKLGGGGRVVPCSAMRSGEHTPTALRAEVDLPNPPSSRAIETFVMPPARAFEELGLATPPIRAVCVDRASELSPREVSGFYLRELRRRGIKAKRRVWSDGSTEQLLAWNAGRRYLVHAEETEDGTFVRLASILEG